MPNPHVINILGSNTSNGDLELDKPDLVAYSRDTVQWKISSSSGVDSIENITEKDGINDVWSTRPIGNNKWKGKIRKKAPYCYDYEYNIIWKKGNEIYTFDPKISINPSPSPSSKNLLFALISLLAISSIIFLFRRDIWKK